MATRLYLSSRRAVKSRATNDLNNFVFKLPDTIHGAEQIYLNEFSLNWVPLYPNIPDRSSRITISYKGETETIAINPTLRYSYIEARDNSQRDDVFMSFTGELNGILHANDMPEEFKEIYFGFDFRKDKMTMYRIDDNEGNEEVTLSVPTDDNPKSMFQRLGCQRRPLDVQLSLELPPQEEPLNPETDDRRELINIRRQKAFPNPPRLSRTEFVYIASDIAHGDSAINEQRLSTNSIIKAIPVPDPTFGSLLHYTSTGSISLSHLRGVRNSITSARITLLDDELEPLELTNQAHMNMELFITYHTPQETEPEQRPNEVKLKAGGLRKGLPT